MRRILFVVLLSSLLAVALVFGVRAQPGGFVIDAADATLDRNMTSSPELNGLLAAVGARFVIQYANALLYVPLAPRPIELEPLLQQVGSRFVFQFANANQFRALDYPNVLIGDTAGPQVRDVTAARLDAGTVRISWTTDEFCTGRLDYGTTSGVYVHGAADPLYYQAHRYDLPWPAANGTIYYRIGCEDRSGNVFVSGEFTFADTPAATPTSTSTATPVPTTAPAPTATPVPTATPIGTQFDDALFLPALGR